MYASTRCSDACPDCVLKVGARHFTRGDSGNSVFAFLHSLVNLFGRSVAPTTVVDTDGGEWWVKLRRLDPPTPKPEVAYAHIRALAKHVAMNAEGNALTLQGDDGFVEITGDFAAWVIQATKTAGVI